MLDIVPYFAISKSLTYLRQDNIKAMRLISGSIGYLGIHTFGLYSSDQNSRSEGRNL